MNRVDRKDIILSILYAPGLSGKKAEPIRGITRVIKLLFLVGRLYGIDKEVKSYYSFEAYKIGPFTEEVYNDLDFLHTAGLVKIKSQDLVEESDVIETQEIPGDLASYVGVDAVSSDSYAQSEYGLTDQGLRIAERRYGQISSSARHAIEDIKRRFGSVPLTALLRYVYRRFPEMAKKTIREDLRGR